MLQTILLGGVIVLQMLTGVICCSFVIFNMRISDPILDPTAYTAVHVFLQLTDWPPSLKSLIFLVYSFPNIESLLVFKAGLPFYLHCFLLLCILQPSF